MQQRAGAVGYHPWNLHASFETGEVERPMTITAYYYSDLPDFNPFAIIVVLHKILLRYYYI